MSKILSFKQIETPVGRLTAVASEYGLRAILWENDNPRRVPLGEMIERKNHLLLTLAEHQLGEYFEKKRQSFDIVLDFIGTSFQREVWHAFLKIPFGKTRTYGDIAREIGKPAARRAVGAACRRNPISIIAPCHRVIGAGGALGGFGGGLAVKRYLLSLESKETA